jgi:predicted DsbA family dithiol-disulfide isomerase
MEIEIFSDVVCPWCAIGKRRFETALASFAHADEVHVIWRAFELDPDAPLRGDGDLVGHLAAKYGMSRQQASDAQSRLTATAAAEGLEFHMDTATRANTFDAHRLLAFAREMGVQDLLKERLFRAYFTEGEVVSDRATLVRLAAEVGLDAATSDEILAGDRYAKEVRADEAEAHALGVTGVPFFVIDRRVAVAGAQSPAVIRDALEQAWTAGHPLVRIGSDEAGSCEGDSCTV